MNKKVLAGLIVGVSASVLLAGCGQDESAMEAEAPKVHETYSAEQFFQTTSYRMGGAGPMRSQQRTAISLSAQTRQVFTTPIDSIQRRVK